MKNTIYIVIRNDMSSSKVLSSFYSFDDANQYIDKICDLDNIPKNKSVKKNKHNQYWMTIFHYIQESDIN